MARPSLIVGLGGTGQWALTWLKRDLMLAHGGKLPHNVKMLSIDTTAQPEASAERVTDKNTDDVTVGDVKLEKSEFLHLGGDSRPLAEMVGDGELPQIGQWYQANKWLSNQTPAAFILDEGAGRIRQFGRMAVFKDMLGQEVGSKIWRALRNSIEAVRAETSENRKLQIMVVGSLAGGTGSGMFIDTALILRLMAQKYNVHHMLLGFFALPSVFTNAPDTEMSGRVFAAWRELNRFMVVDRDFPMPRIDYVEDNPDFRITPDQRLFDACFLLDGKRGDKPLAEQAKYGVFPMMAEALSMMVDEHAGEVYSHFVTTNLAEKYARYPDMPMFSTIGAYTIQVPAHFVQQESGHRFAQHILLRLLGQKDMPEDERLTAAGAKRHLSLAAPDKNQEDKGFRGRQRSLQMLKSSAEYADKTVKPTLYHSRVADIVDKVTTDQQRARQIDQLARAGGAKTRSSASGAGWVRYFPDLGDDPIFEAVRNTVMEHMNYSIIQNYRRREGEKGEETRSRFRRIPEDMRTRFGGMTMSGDEVEDFYGKCGEALMTCQDAQLTLFRRLTRLHLLSILNGRSENHLAAKSGKIGYAWDYFDGLVAHFDTFLELMTEVKKRREEIKPELTIAGLEKKAQNFLRATTGKKIFWVWEHPNVRGAEQAYLQAQERLMDLRREDILHSFVVGTAREMKKIIIETRNVLQRWIWHLATGDDGSQLPGLWDGVSSSLQKVRNAHSFDTATPKVQQLLEDKSIAVNNADLEKSLGQWEWGVSFDGDPKQISLTAAIKPELPGAEPASLADPSRQANAVARQNTGVVNLSELLATAEKRFSGVVARTNVTDEIRRTFTKKQFVDEIASVNAEPLFQGAPRANPKVSTNYIRASLPDNADNTDDYFGVQGVLGELREAKNLPRRQRDDDYDIELVGSENPYKFTLLRTDNLYNFDHYAAWKDCLNAYASHMEKVGQPMDPVLLHNFAAEAYAVDFERRITRDGADYRPLHPRVVMLLENPRGLRQFIYLGMLGMLREDRSRGIYRWQLSWKKKHREQVFWLTRPYNVDRDRSTRAKPDIFNAIHGYVIRKRTWQPNRRDRINPKVAQDLIEEKIKAVRKKKGIDGEIELLETNLETGFVEWLRGLAYDDDDNVRQDYVDLAQVVKMMLIEKIEELKQEKEDERRQSSNRPSGAFAVYSSGGDETYEEAEESSEDDAYDEEEDFSNNPFGG